MIGKVFSTNNKNFIKRLKNKKEDALEWTYDNYMPFVKRIVYDVLIKFNDNGIIEECINDVFISVWNNIDKFDGDKDKFRNWIGAIAKFKAIDYYRNLSKKNEEELNDELLLNDNSLDDELITKERKEEILNLLNVLEETDRKIFIMKYFFGMKAEEISKKLNITKNAVDGRIYRNKKKLKIKAEEIKLEVI